MGEVKEKLKMIDYLNEKGINYDDLKLMIEQSIDTALEKEGEEEPQQEEPQEEDVEQEEKVPTFTKSDVEELVQTEVQKALKIKRKVPSKGKIIDKKDVDKHHELSRKDWFEVLV